MYWARVQGRAMEGFRVYDGDLLLIDKSVTAEVGDLVVADIAGRFALKKLGRGILLAGTPCVEPIPIHGGSDVGIRGVVTHTLRALRQR